MSDRLTTGQGMTTDAPLISANGLYAAYLQDDANLVLCYTTNGAADLSRPYWSVFADAPAQATGQHSGPPFFAIMQADGNFVLYGGYNPGSQGTPYWATGTSRAPGQFTAVIGDDANFVVCDSSQQPIWASGSYEYTCSMEAAFAPDPSQEVRVGYITALNSSSQSAKLQADLPVAVPPQLTPPPAVTAGTATDGTRSMTVIGVIGNFSWRGHSTSPLTLEFYCSQQNVDLIRNSQATPQGTLVDVLNWWVVDYDVETKLWYERCLPLQHQPVSGTLPGSPQVSVDMTPVAAKDGVDINVYKVSLQVAPPANQQYSLTMASSPSRNVAKNWGLPT